MEGLAPELLLQILGFAGPRAAAVYGGCSRTARRLVTDYDFEIFNPPTVDRRFISAPVLVTAADNAAAAEAFKACMELESWRDVWEATAHVVRLPCLGYFSPRETTPFDNEEDARGKWIVGEWGCGRDLRWSWWQPQRLPIDRGESERGGSASR